METGLSLKYFVNNCSRNPPKENPWLYVFLIQVEHELSEITKQVLWYSKLSIEERRATRSLASYRSLIIK